MSPDRTAPYSFFNFASRAKRKAFKRSIFFTAASRRASSCFSASLISASRLLLRSKTDSATTRVLVSSINVPSFGMVDAQLKWELKDQFSSMAFWLLGYPEAALADTDHALTVAREIG